MVPLIDVAKALDSIRQSKDEFYPQDIVDTSGCSRSTACSLLPFLVRKNLLYIVPNTKPYSYKFNTTRTYIELFTEGALDGVFDRGPGPSTRRNKIKVIEMEKPPEEIEIDPIGLLEQLSDNDFGLLIASYVTRKNAELDPLKDEIVDLKTRLNLSYSKYENDSNNLTHSIESLRRELRDEKEKLIHARNEIQSLKNQLVRKEAPLKVVMVDRPISTRHDGPVVVVKRKSSAHSNIIHRNED